MDSINYNLTGTVFDIQRFSLHDGPGIRTIVFLKGCPLSCKWCSNPESQSIEPVMLYKKEECMHCLKCVRACKIGAIDPVNPTWIDRNKCTGCGQCMNVCPAGALVLKGRTMSVQSVLKELKKDASTYRRSGGGITLSGGESLVQFEFASELLKAAKAQGFHTAIETTGFGLDQAIQAVIPYVDTVLLDIKHMDPLIHKQGTGVDNKLLLKNAPIISKMANTVVRIPIIPGFNYDKKAIMDIVTYTKTLTSVDTIHLLAYHSFGENKYSLLGKEYALKGVKQIKPEELEEYKTMVESFGFTCVIGG